MLFAIGEFIDILPFWESATRRDLRKPLEHLSCTIRTSTPTPHHNYLQTIREMGSSDGHILNGEPL
jgi:SPX domain protein involved in polyphosphate accumulation